MKRKLVISPASGGGRERKAVWNVAPAANLTTGDNKVIHKIIETPGSPSLAWINANDAPSGADTIIDIKYFAPGSSTGNSVFGTTKLVLPDGSNRYTVVQQVVFADGMHFEERGILEFNVVQVAPTPGKRYAVYLFW